MCSWHCCVYQRRAVTQVRRVWCRRTEHRAGGKISTPEEQEEHHMCPTKWPTSGYSWMFLTKCVRSRLQEVGMRSKSPLMLRNPHAACLGPTNWLLGPAITAQRCAETTELAGPSLVPCSPHWYEQVCQTYQNRWQMLYFIFKYHQQQRACQFCCSETNVNQAAQWLRMVSASWLEKLTSIKFNLPHRTEHWSYMLFASMGQW